MTSTFIEENQDFILKLKVKATDGSSQIRRVKLPRIADGAGNVSYEELVGLVVTFTFPDGNVDNYTVSLTYFDVDEDTVTIASTDELVDAIEQFAGKKLLRITTEVKPRTTASVPAVASPTTRAQTDTTAAKPIVTPGSAIQPQVQNVLESFVGVLATAVTSLQDGLAVPPIQSTHKAATSAAAAAATTPPPPPSKPADIAPPKVVVTETKKNELSSPAKAAPQTSNNNNDTTTNNSTNNTKKQPEKEERPFIHGRHTCDSCLSTPIIGKRYNAINLPDYDLCEPCFKNYKGKEIKFKPVELDRDCAFQERWNRRRQKVQSLQHRRCARNRHRGGPRGRGFNNAKPEPACNGASDRATQVAAPSIEPTVKPTPVPPCPARPPAPSAPPCPQSSHHESPSRPFWAPNPDHCAPHANPHMTPHMGSHVSTQTMQPNPFDDALKEAIRRSLQDIDPKEVEDAISSSPKATAPSEELLVTVPKVETVDESQADAEENTNEEVPRATEEKSVDLVTENAPSLLAEAKVLAEKQLEDSMETGSVDSEKLVAEKGEAEADKESDKKPPAIITRETSDASNQAASVDDSFASDAVGLGDVAEAMGTTLDIVAGVIGEMLKENSTIDNVAKENKKPDIEEEELGEAKDEKTKTQTEDVSSPAEDDGALILDSVESGTKKSEENEDADWDIVAPAGGEDNNEIARATEMLGSALFNSDMRSSEEDHVSALSASDSFSLATSVPSSVPTISNGRESSSVVAPAQRNVWAAHLEKLKELGFNNEALCVDVLERLNAANIGVGSDDEISVTQVVNAILEEN